MFYRLDRTSPYPGLMEVFREGVAVRSGELTGFGTTRGGLFRRFCILEPALGAEVAALGVRKRRRHFGPINRHEVTLNRDCDQLLQDVQRAVDNSHCCRQASRSAAT